LSTRTSSPHDPPVLLVPAELHLVAAALAGDGALADAIGYRVADEWATFPGALRAVHDQLVADPASAAWGSRFFVSGEPPHVVGWGGFKGPPVDGTVELGYEIAAGLRGQGLATAAARAMLDEAFAHPEVATVIAHTLAEPNASNHILTKLGFHHTGEIVEDGERVWRFERGRAPGTDEA
jgi:ribosomal-protein-alanine N-acetyltransferase